MYWFWFDLPAYLIVDGVWLPGTYLAVYPITGSPEAYVLAGPEQRTDGCTELDDIECPF